VARAVPARPAKAARVVARAVPARSREQDRRVWLRPWFGFGRGLASAVSPAFAGGSAPLASAVCCR
jgi:hypothetical protein